MGERCQRVRKSLEVEVSSGEVWGGCDEVDFWDGTEDANFDEKLTSANVLRVHTGVMSSVFQLLFLRLVDAQFV